MDDPAHSQKIQESVSHLDPSAPWWHVLLALIPFLLLPVAYLVFGLLDALNGVAGIPEPGVIWLLMMAGVWLVALLFGEIRGFPRWTFPYWGVALLVTFYFQGFSGSISGEQFRGTVMVWLPLLSVALLGMLYRRGLDPLRELVATVRSDWTVLTFTLYGALPLLFWASYDETNQKWVLFLLVLPLLALGAFFYMRGKSIRQRITALLGGFLSSWVVMVVHIGIYWNNRLEPWMSEPSTWQGALRGMLPVGVVVLALMLAPALLGLLPRARQTA